MKLISYMILGAAALTGSAAAQDITTEVVVERTVEPVERAATRPSALVPALSLSPVAPVSLSTAHYSGLAPVVRSFTRLQPVEGAANPERGPWRGYLSVGYFPVYNLGVAAGYRAIESERQTLDIHLNFNGFSYKPWDEVTRNYSYNGATVGADYALRVGSKSTLRASLDYNYGSSATFFRKAQGRNYGRLALDWSSAVQGLDYRVWLGGSIDAFGKAKFDLQPVEAEIDGLKQERLNVGAQAALPFADHAAVGLRADLDLLHSAVDKALGESNTPAIVNLRPFVSYNTLNLTATAGVNLDIASKLYVSPHVEIAWTPASMISVKASAMGMTGFNSAADALNISPFVAGVMPGERCRVPYDISGEIVAGPFAGFSITVSGGYSYAENWLVGGRTDFVDPLATTKLKGFNAGVRLDYSHKYFDIHASGRIADSDMANEKGYYMWRDGAKAVIEAGTAVRPIDRLTINIDYEFRSHRHTPFVSLGCSSELSVGADFRCNDRLSVWADVENILGRRYFVVPTIYSQKLHGLVGFTYKF